MSFLKGFALAVFSMLLIVFLVLFQAHNTLSNTALSSAYFNDAFDRNVTGESIEGFASYLKSAVGDTGDEDLTKAVRDAIDVNWLQKDMPAFMKGSFRYFTTGEGEMPSVSVKTLKDALKKAIDRKAGDFSSIAQSQIGLDKMKDSFDPNVYFSKLYGGSVNPVSAFGGLLSGTRASFLLLIALTALLLSAIIAVIAYRPRSILKCGGACLLPAGLICALGALLLVALGNSGSAFAAALFGSGGESELLFLQNWALSYAGGVVTYMLVQGLIVAALGVAFLVAAGFIKESGKPERSGHVAIRAAAALLLLAAIPFSAYLVGKSYYTRHVEPFMSAQEIRGKMTPGQAFDATMGGSLGQLFFDEAE